MFITALLIRANDWEKTKCPLIGKNGSRNLDIVKMEYYSAKKKDKLHTCSNMDESQK